MEQGGMEVRQHLDAHLCLSLGVFISLFGFEVFYQLGKFLPSFLT